LDSGAVLDPIFDMAVVNILGEGVVVVVAFALGTLVTEVVGCELTVLEPEMIASRLFK
jgi:hypothetical protein